MLPSWTTDPLWDQLHALLPERIDQHPLGCHRPRIPDRIVLDELVQVLVFGCDYQRVADHTCSARTLRRRRDEWIAAGVAVQFHRLALADQRGTAPICGRLSAGAAHRRARAVVSRSR